MNERMPELVGKFIHRLKGLEIERTMMALRKKIAKQKREKEQLELQIFNIYGGSEKGIEKEEQMNVILAENKQLQSKLDELQKEQADI